jgi:hypothetical protein
MSTAANDDPRIESVRVDARFITMEFVDGRVVSVPLDWSWRLEGATPAQRVNFAIVGRGPGVPSPEVDEDLSAVGMLRGVPAPRPVGVAQGLRANG